MSPSGRILGYAEHRLNQKMGDADRIYCFCIDQFVAEHLSELAEGRLLGGMVETFAAKMGALFDVSTPTVLLDIEHMIQRVSRRIVRTLEAMWGLPACERRRPFRRCSSRSPRRGGE